MLRAPYRKQTSRSTRVPRGEFEAYVRRAVRDLPREFRDRLENVEFVVESRPSPTLLRMRGAPAGGTLLGLYAGGTPFHKYGLPGRIVIFVRPPVRGMSERHESHAAPYPHAGTVGVPGGAGKVTGALARVPQAVGVHATGALRGNRIPRGH